MTDDNVEHEAFRKWWTGTYVPDYMHDREIAWAAWKARAALSSPMTTQPASEPVAADVVVAWRERVAPNDRDWALQRPLYAAPPTTDADLEALRERCARTAARANVMDENGNSVGHAYAKGRLDAARAIRALPLREE